MKVDVKAAESWHEKYDQSQAEVTELRGQIEKLQQQLDLFAQQLRLANASRFAPSSEKTAAIIDQVSLFNEAEAEADPTVPEPDIEQAVPKRKKQKGKTEELRMALQHLRRYAQAYCAVRLPAQPRRGMRQQFSCRLQRKTPHGRL